MKKVLVSLALLAGSLMACGRIFAHHGSRASYDLSRTVAMTGVVTEFIWQNPHVYVMYDVTDKNGTVTHWGAETYSPIVMIRDGWTKDELKSGDKVTISVWPARTGSARGFLAKLVGPDGKVTDLTGRVVE